MLKLTPRCGPGNQAPIVSAALAPRQCADTTPKSISLEVFGEIQVGLPAATTCAFTAPSQPEASSSVGVAFQSPKITKGRPRVRSTTMTECSRSKLAPFNPKLVSR